MVSAARTRDFSRKLLLSKILLCASAALAEDDRRHFLYVPPGGGAHRVLQETPRDALPPGEYEVVALFEGGKSSPFSDYRVQQQKMANFPRAQVEQKDKEVVLASSYGQTSPYEDKKYQYQGGENLPEVQGDHKSYSVPRRSHPQQSSFYYSSPIKTRFPPPPPEYVPSSRQHEAEYGRPPVHYAPKPEPHTHLTSDFAVPSNEYVRHDSERTKSDYISSRPERGFTEAEYGRGKHVPAASAHVGRSPASAGPTAYVEPNHVSTEPAYVGLNQVPAEPVYVTPYHAPEEPKHIRLYNAPQISQHVSSNRGPVVAEYDRRRPAAQAVVAEYDRRRPAAQAVESEYDRRRPAAEAVEPEYERRRPPALELSSEYVGRGPATVEAEPEYVRPRREDFTTKQRTRVPAYDPRESTEYHQQQQINHWTGYDLKEQDSHLLFDDVQHQTNSVENVYVTPKPANAKRRKKNGAQELKKLYEIASSGESATSVKSSFKCPRDGHFGDKDDCAKFYRCAHGKALEEYCPGGLFWNSASEQCDWPETVDCSYNSVSMAAFKVKRPTTLFLTFDDGPNEGTDGVLDALSNQNVKATFFINSMQLHDSDPAKAARNMRTLVRMVKDGHVLADHSYDHMKHNSNNSPRNAYKSVKEDLKYFGLMNTYPVLDIFWKANYKEAIPSVNHTMTYYVRMPYTNNWRVGDQIRDCHGCTIPASSGSTAIAIADRLRSSGKLVFGWDVEWDINWDNNRFKYGGKDLFFRLARNPSHGSRLVILSHDVAHRPGGAIDGRQELEEFIRLARQAGYQFDTVNNY